MDTRIIGPVACVNEALSLSSVGFTIGAAVAVLCWALAGVQAGLELEPQVPPPSQPAAKPDKAKTKAVVPFEMLPTNHMLVEARINDKGPYHLIFDLGARSRF